MDVYDEVDRRENDAGEWSGTCCKEQGPSVLRSGGGEGCYSEASWAESLPAVPLLGSAEL